MKATRKWQVVENVVAAIEKARADLPGVLTTQRAQLPRLTDPTDSRDVDVLVEVPVGGRTLLIGVEVKNKSRPLTIDQMGGIVDLRRDIRVDRFCVVSTSGFSQAARKKATENGIEMVALEEFQSSSFWASSPETMLMRTGGSILHLRFDFGAEVLAAFADGLQTALNGTAHDEILLTDATGTVTVTQLASYFLHAHLQQLDPPAQDGDELTLRVDLRQRTDSAISARGSTFPGPEFFTVVAKVEKTVERVPEYRFRMGDIEATTRALNLTREVEQFSLIAVPRPGRGTDIVFARGESHPTKRTKS